MQPRAETGITARTDKPLTVVIGADTFSPNVNGSARFSQRLASGLAARGHDVHVVAPAATRKHGTWVEEYDGQDITVHRLRSYRWYPHDWLRWSEPWFINKNSDRILDEVDPDVVHFQSHIIVGRGLSIAARKRGGVRIIGTNHFMPENLLEFTLLPKSWQERAVGMAWRAAKRTFGRADVVTTPTQSAADFLEKYTGLDGVLAISCGIDAENYTPDFTPRTENRILFVGRVTGEKQIDVLIKAMTLLPADLDAKLDIVGGGDLLKHLENLAKQLGVADRVNFTGYVTEDELRAAYTNATVFAMPSIAELQSIATMEAMASGLPVVAANAMALPHLVKDDQNGFLFQPGDAQELADKLERLLRLPQEELDTFKRASLRFIQAHDLQRTIMTFEQLYRGASEIDVPALEAELAAEATAGASAGAAVPAAPDALQHVPVDSTDAAH
ncbi:glycosyltransferase [Subtercola endophyticus]|uniref:glycosyltransferase n=1 Tax=Subtercola endophyticus TaxID=2895559 RepID=UPI001E6110F4|nr:glycosyltransferase [Subtercola endophyticus]UFS61084.1 glycosyltransferase [Subtercola endophyticus]